MAVQLTPEQEHRIQAVVDRGAYGSIEEALDAALGIVEATVESAGDLDAFLLHGVASPELAEDQFWSEVDRATTTS
ncbi:MAG: hypothetical protein WDO18_09910 [Acidobacteriota bacterium]